MIVTLASSSFLTSRIFVFLTYKFVIKVSVVLLWSGHHQAGKERGLYSGSSSGSVLLVSI